MNDTDRPDEARYDTAVYNKLHGQWVREGKKLTQRQAYNRLNYRKTNSFPEAKFKIVKVPGRKPTK